ncbi:MAG: hypothetical protein AB8G05_01565 [Oligoflexales bacterium]
MLFLRSVSIFLMIFFINSCLIAAATTQNTTALLRGISNENKRIVETYETNQVPINSTHFSILLRSLQGCLVNQNRHQNHEIHINSENILIHQLTETDEVGTPFVLNHLLTIGISENNDGNAYIGDSSLMASILMFNIATIEHRSNPYDRAKLEKVLRINRLNKNLLEQLASETVTDIDLVNLLIQLVNNNIALLELSREGNAPQA